MVIGAGDFLPNGYSHLGAAVGLIVGAVVGYALGERIGPEE